MTFLSVFSSLRSTLKCLYLLESASCPIRVIYAQLVQIWHLSNVFKQLLNREPITGTGTEIGDAFRVDVLSKVTTPQAGSEKVALSI